MHKIIYIKTLSYRIAITFIIAGGVFGSCSNDNITSSFRDTTFTLLFGLNELALDIHEDSTGYFFKDTIWTYQDFYLKNVRITFLGEVDTVSTDCSVSFFLYYFIDSVHQHIYTYSQFGLDSINIAHQFDLSVEEFRNNLLYYQFQVFIHKKTAYTPSYIKLYNIKIFNKSF